MFMYRLNVFAAKEAARHQLDVQTVKPWKVTLLYAVLTQILSLISSYLSKYFLAPYLQFTTVDELYNYISAGNYQNILYTLGVFFCVSLILFCFDVAYTNYALQVSQGRPSGIKTLAQGFALLPKALAVLFFSALLIFALCFVSGLLLALLPPALSSVLSVALLFGGSILLFYSLRMILYVIADRRDLHAIAAVRECFRLSKGNKRALFMADLSFLWFFLIVGIVNSFLSDVGILLFQRLTSNTGSALAALLTSHMDLYGFIFDFISLVVVAALYCWKYHHIKVAYACLYQQLKDLCPTQTSKHPLAYEEYPKDSTEQ